MKVFLTGALLAGALLSATPAGAANLVLNPGLETGDLGDWVASVGGDGFDLGVDQYALDVHGGAWGAYMGNATTTTLAQSIATTAGATYLVSFWLDVYQSQAFDGGFSASFGGQP